MEEYITSTSAAKLAGVGVSSIKRWADDGKLRTIRTPGGHRRLIRSDFMAFLRDPEGHSVLDPDEKVGIEWADAMLELDFHALQAKLLVARGRSGSWLKTMDELSLGIAETGVRWTEKSITIAQEHIATDLLSRALSSIYESIPVAPNAPVCLLSNVEGDLHTLGLSMLQVVLRELGWRCVWLGASTPMEEIRQYLQSQNVELVALSASKYSSNTEVLKAQLDFIANACRETKTQLLIGGMGAWPEELPYGTRATSLKSLSNLRSIQL